MNVLQENKHTMKREIRIGIFIISTIILLIGIRGIFQSTKRGLKEGNDAIWENGGSMETNQYNLIVEESIRNYRITGVILTTLGGCGMLTVLKYVIEQEE